MTVVVLDPAWTPLPGDRPDVVAIRPVFGAVTSNHDLFDEALDRLDAWAASTAIADRLIIEDVTYWFRMRETMWRWLHERLLWRYALEMLGADDVRRSYVVPGGEAALVDIASRIGDVEVVGTTSPATAATVAPTSAGRLVGSASVPRRLARLLGRLLHRSRAAGRTAATATYDDRDQAFDQRLHRMLADPGPRILVLTTPVTYQRVASAADGRRDPILGSVMSALEDAGFRVSLLAIGLEERRAADRAVLEADERMLPQSLLRTRWSDPADDARVERALAAARSAVGALQGTPFDAIGLDLGEAFLGALRDALEHVLGIDVLQRARVERLLDELQPRAVVLAQEGVRVPWLTAGQAAGIPVFAIQHGILYPGHPGYPHQRHARVSRARRTFVNGDYEREMLLSRGAYLDDEVEASGSPRLDLDVGAEAVSDRGHAAADRDAVRRALGVRDGDRLLVVSTVHLPFVQRAHFAPMIERVLGGPLPGVHVVFKQHPGERTEGPHRDLVLGLATAGGYDPPPVSVVRDIDLYRLLRAADAHLGQHSTVLTDAVAVGTPNLIALTDAHADILGYVEAGVARPVRGVDDVRAELADPVAPSAEARARFLERHFRPGPAGVRIAASISEIVASRGAAS